uniref:Putative ovule protein n=1 Tax=Solanum chacoense TaxID=4108 RepID=A0A0V0GRC7_SOLCH
MGVAENIEGPSSIGSTTEFLNLNCVQLFSFCLHSFGVVVCDPIISSNYDELYFTMLPQLLNVAYHV